MIGGFQGSDRCVGDFRDILIFHFFEISQAENYPLFFRKSLYGLVQLPLKMVAVEAAVFVDLFFKQG